MWFDLLEIELKIDPGTEFGMKLILEYRGSPTYTKITNTVSTTTVFWLMYVQVGDFRVVGDLLQSH